MSQLALALRLADHASFATFVAPAHEPAVHHAAAVAAGARDAVWLWGAEGTGKTHLLQAACRAAAPEVRAMYVPLREVTPDMLLGLESMDLLALDDLQAVAGSAPWERRLFGLLNEFLTRPGSLLLTATAPAAQCGFSLLDLKSRAASATSYRLEPLTDEGRIDALLRHAGARGLELESSAAEYLVRRVDRDMRTLTAWLDRLDRDSLVAQRRLTIPFIRSRLTGEQGSGE